MKPIDDSVKQTVAVPVYTHDLNLISELETAIDLILTNPILLSIILDKRKLLFLVPIRELYDRASFELFKEDIKIIIGNDPLDWLAGIAFALLLPTMYIFIYMIGGLI